jgi:hypothetical protein
MKKSFLCVLSISVLMLFPIGGCKGKSPTTATTTPSPNLYVSAFVSQGTVGGTCNVTLTDKSASPGTPVNGATVKLNGTLVPSNNNSGLYSLDFSASYAAGSITLDITSSAGNVTVVGVMPANGAPDNVTYMTNCYSGSAFTLTNR